MRDGERDLAPDLARGVALLGIALANSVGHLSGRELGPSGRPVDGSAADRAVDAVVGTLVDNRAFPMFTLLFAYGLVMVLRRQAALGVPWPVARGVLVRRCLWLAAFGVLHGVLLFTGDVLLAYGVLGLVVVGLLLRAGDRALLVWAAAALVVFTGLSAVDGVTGLVAPAQAPFGLDATSPAGALGERALSVLGNVLLSPFIALALVPPAALGLWAARRQVLERPGEHLRLLRVLAVGGSAVSALGALPLVLASLQVWQVGWVTGLAAGALHAVTGLAGAVAFAALVAWSVARRQRAGAPARPGGVLGALAAVGQRSLTCYLLQSVLLVPLMAPWAGGLGVGAGTARAAALAVGAYLVTLVVAVLLARAGRPGPAEQLLRRLVYGRVSAAAPAAPAIPRDAARGSVAPPA